MHEGYSDVVGCLMMEALTPFIRRRGGQVVLAKYMKPSLDHMYNPKQRTVTIDGRVRHIVYDGSLFIYLPGVSGLPEEKVVVSAEFNETPRRLVFEITVRSSRDSTAFLQEWKDAARQHNYLRGRAFFADGELAVRSRLYTWEDVFLPEDVKHTVRTHVENFLRNRPRLKALGVKGRRGLILEGPPGTGKTLMGKVLADTVDASFIWVSPRHVQNPGSFADILEVARFVAPSVIFFEDLDLYAEDRDGGRHSALLGELMNQLDGALDNEDIVTIATTNRLGVVEKALRNRPGRFDRVLSLGTLDDDCRRRLLVRLMARATLSSEDLTHLVSATDGYTGAQIEELANTLYILAVDGHDDASGNGDGKPSVAIDRPLIAAALEEFQVELKARVGFHAA
ncbi:ATP-binding protein [Candidatus Bathyarchaeota archaeon]|nr:ATP-binding protein [Candidatus Bathyarchaeota archaeon]